MIWMMLLPAWCIALVGVVALCRAAHLEDVARGFVDDVVLPVPSSAVPAPTPAPRVPAPRQEALPLAR